MGVSRLLAEEIERFRLNSYTEKSQRYIKLEGNYVIPRKLRKSKHEARYKEMVSKGIALYRTLYDRIVQCELRKLPHAPGKEEKKRISLKANEDARYVLSLAQKTQIGETINARNLELLIRRFASSELEEARECAKKMFGLAKRIAPSILLFCEENEFDKLTYPSLREYVRTIKKQSGGTQEETVSLIEWTRNADTLLVSTLLHSVSNMSFGDAYDTAKTLSRKKKRELLKKVFNHLELYDAVLREFEHIRCTFSIIVSASCFAQLKRHRVATLTYQRYDPELGVTIPQSVFDSAMDRQFIAFIDRTNALYEKMKASFPVEAAYLLTNAHRRRVLLSMNARELYHMSRLREDEHAQWEIREATKTMIEKVRKKMPLTLLVTAGKDRYPEIYRSIFGKYPRIIHPVLPR
jgi:flavin-dependent thymidylate synthase